MKYTNQSIENLIQMPPLNGIPRSEGQIHPRYDGYSIANIPASVCRWLDCPTPADRPLAEEIVSSFQKSYQHIIFVVVDGLGLNFLQHYHMDEVDGNPLPEWKALLQDGALLPLTSICPSTTSAALTTFWTNRLPAEHGIIGYELFLREFGLVANMITHSVASFIGENGNLVKAGFKPESFLPMPTLGAHFRDHEIKTFALQHESISGSGLSQMLLNDTQTFSFQSLDEMWDTAASIQVSQKQNKTFTYLYWGDLDTRSHRSGPLDRQIFQLWDEFSQRLARFILSSRSWSNANTLLILTADHGQIPNEINPDYDLHNHPEFTRHLIMMPSGESRLPILFIKPGHDQEIQVYLENHWDSQFSAVRSDKVIQSGLLGNCPAYEGTVERLGQYVVFPKNDAYWWWVNKENHLLGRHGGLSQQEMLVPFFALEM
jgi:arylsulfatase A-like enzyme